MATGTWNLDNSLLTIKFWQKGWSSYRYYVYYQIEIPLNDISLEDLWLGVTTSGKQTVNWNTQIVDYNIQKQPGFTVRE